MPLRSPHSRSTSVLLMAVLALLVALLLSRGFIERSFHLLQTPLAAAGTWIYKQTIPKDRQKLEEQIRELAIDRIQFEALQKENEELKQAIGFINRNAANTLTASIISRSFSSRSSLFVIDKGYNDGLRLNNPVFIKEGILVGKIVQTTPSSATVETLTDSQMATAVGILGSSQTLGVAEGITGNLLRMKFIPLETQIRVNDMVVTSGLDPNIPPGLFVGLINDVRPEPNAPFLEAIIEPAVDIRQISIVHILALRSQDE